MRDYRCPTCENDITQAITDVIISRLKSDAADDRQMLCPHCGAELTVEVTVGAEIAAA